MKEDMQDWCRKKYRKKYEKGFSFAVKLCYDKRVAGDMVCYPFSVKIVWIHGQRQQGSHRLRRHRMQETGRI